MIMKDILKNKDIKINLILTIVAVVLLFSAVFSSISNSKSDKRKKTSTALLNPKNVSNVHKIDIINIDGTVNLEKQKDFWLIKSSDSDYVIPANSSYISTFLKDLSHIVDLYEITGLTVKNNNNFFPVEQTTCIKYFYNDSDFTTLYFGSYDFSQSYRYFRSEKNTKVYEINTELDKYLQTAFQVWTEPNLISQNVLGKIDKADIQRVVSISKDLSLNKVLTSSSSDFETRKYNLLELRHGGKASEQKLDSDKIELKLTLELGNKNEITMNFYKIDDSKEDYYIVEEKYNQYQTYYYKISLWTYNKIKEIIL